VKSKRHVLFVFLTLTLFSVVFTVTDFASAHKGLVVYINSDTAWTKANSPYTLTGPTVVSPGVTLTINSGVTVNMNGYILFINGTLKAVGSLSGNIQINGDNMTFGASAGSGSVFENVVSNASITSANTLVLSNNTMSNSISVGDSSVIANNIIVGSISTGNAATFTKNVITGDITAGNSTTFSGNNIRGDISAGTSTTFSGNYINGTGLERFGIMGHDYATALTVGDSSVISNNAISGGVSASSSAIFNNTIVGGGPFTDWLGRPEDATSAVQVTGACSVTSNVIYSTTGGYGILVQGGTTTVSGNYVKNTIRVAGNATVEGNFVSSGGIQVGDIFINAFNAIDYGSGNALIKNNIMNGSSSGVFSSYVGGTAIIQDNLIVNNTYGVNLVSQATIQNNTISTSSVAISLTNTSPLINYNNILSYSQNSVLLVNNQLNVNATYNWWGTTDIQAINLTIHDFKYDLSLGTVNFTPILDSQNIQAPLTSYTIQLPKPPSITTQTVTATSSPAPTAIPAATATSSSTASTTPTPIPSATVESSSSPTAASTPTIPEYTLLTVVLVVTLAVVMLTLSLHWNRKRQIH